VSTELTNYTAFNHGNTAVLTLSKLVSTNNIQDHKDSANNYENISECIQ